MVNFIASLVVILSPIFIIFYKNVFWIMGAGLLTILIMLIKPSLLNGFFQKEMTLKKLWLPISLLAILIIIIPFVWWLIIFGNHFLTMTGMAIIIFEKTLDIRNVFVPYFVTSSFIAFFILYYLARYCFLQKKTGGENSDEIQKKITSNEIQGKIILSIVGIIFFFPLILLNYGIVSGKSYLDFLPKKPVEEVIITTYGEIPSYIVNAAVNSIEQEIGILVTIGESYSRIKPEGPFYNPERNQFYADKIWEMDENFPGDMLFGNSRRIINIVDVDLYTEIQPERPYVFSRSSPNTQTILISTYYLEKLSETNGGQAPEELVASRMHKITLQTLSRSVSLRPLLPHENKLSEEDCVTIGKYNLTELDNGKDVFSERVRKKDMSRYFDI